MALSQEMNNKISFGKSFSIIFLAYLLLYEFVRQTSNLYDQNQVKNVLHNTRWP